MHPLNGLPKTARLTSSKLMDDLVIDNQKVLYVDGLFAWLTYATNWDWNDYEDNVLPQLVSQGFKVEAVKEQCMIELQETGRLVGVLYHLHDYEGGGEDEFEFKSDSDEQERPIVIQMIKKISMVKDWEELNHILYGCLQFCTDMLSNTHSKKNPKMEKQECNVQHD